MLFQVGMVLLALLMLVVVLVLWGLVIYLLILAVKALRKYLGGGDNRPETLEARKSLGEAIKAHRARCGMTRSSWRGSWG